MKWLIIFCLIFGQLGVGQYNSLTKKHEIKNDEGQVVKTIEKNRLLDQYDIRDEKGRHTGTIKYNDLTNKWEIREKGAKK